MRHNHPLAYGLLVVQIWSLATPFWPASAQGLYGAGYQLQPPHRHRDITREPAGSSTDESPISGNSATAPVDHADAALPVIKDRIATTGPLHDQDWTTDPWSSDAEKQFVFKKRIAENTEKIQKQANNCELYISRADAYLHLGQSAQSIEDSNKAIQLNPASKLNLSNAYCNRGEALLQLKRYSEALKDLIKAISLDDENAEAIYFRGMARERLGQLEMAMKDYAIARDLGFAPKGVKVDFSEYMAELQRTIKKNWHPIKSDKSRKTVVHFHLLRNGQVENVRVDSDSLSSQSNEEAIAAVKEAAPFQPLPKGAPRAVDVSFNFDYNVSKNGVPSREADLARLTTEGKTRVEAAEKSGDETALFTALIAQGDGFRDRGSLTFAEDNYRRAQNIVERRGDNGIDKAKVLARLAGLDSLRDKKKEAETLYSQSLEIALQAGKPLSDPDTGEILRDYAKLLYKDSRFDDVKKMYDRFKAQ